MTARGRIDLNENDSPVLAIIAIHMWIIDSQGAMMPSRNRWIDMIHFRHHYGW